MSGTPGPAAWLRRTRPPATPAAHDAHRSPQRPPLFARKARAPRLGGRAYRAAVASDREPRAPSPVRSEIRSAAVGRSLPSGRRSVIGVEHFPARGRGGDVAPSPPQSFGREHRRRVSRRGSPVPPGLGRFATAGGRRATPGRWRTPGHAPLVLATFARALTRATSPSRHQAWTPPTPEWGRFRTLNWTLNAKSRPQRERRSGRSAGTKHAN
jgi:hypothetical protein